MRESLVRALKLEGYDVEAVSDGEQALATFDSIAPAVIVLDIMMPNVDGLTVCRRLRSRRVTTPILMLTARHEVSDRVSGLDAGADDYVVKPFALDELSARLRALLRRTSVSGSEDVVPRRGSRRSTRWAAPRSAVTDRSSSRRPSSTCSSSS